MSIIKRMSTSLFARVDEMVGEIENHDALIKAAITEQRKKIAAAKVQLKRLQSSEQKVSEQIAELKAKEQRWSDRAIKEAEDNEQQALACLQRRQLVREKIVKLIATRDNYQQTAAKMTSDIARCDQELAAMSQKHELMRARQSSADALNVINEVNGSSIDELETSFERWETRITQGELNVDSYELTDSLEESYLDQESNEALRTELNELLKQEKDDA